MKSVRTAASSSGASSRDSPSRVVVFINRIGIGKLLAGLGELVRFLRGPVVLVPRLVDPRYENFLDFALSTSTGRGEGCQRCFWVESEPSTLGFLAVDLRSAAYHTSPWAELRAPSITVEVSRTKSPSRSPSESPRAGSNGILGVRPRLPRRCTAALALAPPCLAEGNRGELCGPLIGY